MKEQKKQPELRFKGFTDDWEQRKLGDITKISTGKLDANAMVENGKYDFYTSGIKKYRIDVAAFEGPSITIAGNGATVGYMHLADNKFNAYQRTYVLQEFLVDRSFIFSEIGNKLPKKIKQEARTGNIPYIVMDMLTELKLSIPQNNSEQQKIGSFFKQLDDTIALHQRKHDLLKKLKQGYLQQMFPVKNEVVPQLRFSGFKDDWGQIKFKNIIIRVNKSSNSNKLPKIEFEDISAGEGRLNKDISKKFDTRKGIEFEPNDILYGKLRPYLKNWLMPNFKGIALGDFWIFRSTNNISNFVYNLIQTNKYQKAANDTSGTKMPRSDWKKVSETMFFISKNLEEQQKIGEFFQKLDQDLSLQQLKIEQLQQLKQAYLQKLFP